MQKRVGVVFSGCGYLDGTEITEAVSILIALDRRGVHRGLPLDEEHVVADGNLALLRSGCEHTGDVVVGRAADSLAVHV